MCLALVTQRSGSDTLGIWSWYTTSMKEIDLFNILKICFMPDLEKSESQYSRFDCFSSKWKLDIELKCRRTHYDELLIEKDKYDALLKRAEENGTRPFYINSTPQGIYAFALDEFNDLQWEMKGGLPKTTDFYDNRRIVKEVAFLPIYAAIKLNEDADTES